MSRDQSHAHGGDGGAGEVREDGPTVVVPSMRVVVFREGDSYVAECVDYNISAHGDTADEATQKFGDAVIHHVLAREHVGLRPFKGEKTGMETAMNQWNTFVSRHADRIVEFQAPSFVTRKRGALGEQVAYTGATHCVAMI